MIWTHFLMQANLYLILFFILYKILLAKETHFTLNRVYLISAACISLLLPFLRFEWIQEQNFAQQVYGSVEQWREIVIIPSSVSTVSQINWGLWIIGAYFTGIILFTIRFFFRLFLVQKSLKATNPGTAFSFFNKKVIAQDIPSLNIIDYHEETHINQKHSWDIIFFEILNIFFWFNPAIYGYKIAIKNIHEYLADEAAAAYQGCKESYAMLILSRAFQTDVNQLTNKFFTQSQVKKRIYMLYKDRSTKRAIWKYGLVAPIFAIALLVSASTIQKNQHILAVANSLDQHVEDFVSKPILKSTAKKKAIAANNLSVEDENTIQVLKEQIAKIDSITTPVYKQNDIESIQANVELKRNLMVSINKTISAIKPVASSTKGSLNTVLEAQFLDIPPSYPGGMERFYDFMGNSIKYPTEASESNKHGIVYLSFIVEENGTISNVNTIGKKLGYGLEEEAIRVLKKSKVWAPGILAGSPTRSRYQVPIRFALPTENSIVTLPEIKTRANLAAVLKNMIVGTQISGIEDAMYIIDGKQADYNAYSGISPHRIERISFMNPTDARNQFGSAYSKGAIVIESAPEF